jgi:lipopolysaccharide export LptBFGC system permease protein LptF
MICVLLLSSSVAALTSVLILFSSLWIIPLYSVQSIELHRIQWDEAQVIHKEENTITTELKELVLITRADSQANALAP